MTTTEFTDNPNLRAQLLAILNDPVYVAATEAVRDQMRPRPEKEANALPALAAARYHQVAGANDFESRLRDLTKTPVERKPLRGRSLDKDES